MLLESTYNSTIEFINITPKTKRKNHGQFFTSLPTACFMGTLANTQTDSVKVLDAGAGTGILAASIIEKLLAIKSIKHIHIDLYENNDFVLPVLKANVDEWLEQANKINKRLTANIINRDFLIDNEQKWADENYVGEYDIIISNPPYKKISKSDAESTMMSKVVYGQPNTYFLFMAMAVKLLKNDGEFIFIVPRSWSSGLYFTAFRRYFFENMKVQNLHLFISRDKVFTDENVLQEILILRAIKSSIAPQKIQITSCDGDQDFQNIRKFQVPYDICIQNQDLYFMFLPTSSDDVDVLNIIDSFPDNLIQLGFKLKTGLTVDFRSTQWLRSEPSEKAVPLLWAFHFNGGRVHFPKDATTDQYIMTDNKALLMPTSNYLLLKRFTSKEEKRRLQPAIVLKNDFSQWDFISTENHLNFITRVDGILSVDEVFGLYVIFASTLWDKYFRILNGSTQVNATEINAIPIPSLAEICILGAKAQQYNQLTTNVCDLILEELVDEKRRSKANSKCIGHAAETAS